MKRERTNFSYPNRGILTVGLNPILMFHTILESGDQTNNIEDEFKTIRLIQINTKRKLSSFHSFSDMKKTFWIQKGSLKHEKTLS